MVDGLGDDPRLYHDLARLWPRLSPPEDYAPEAAHLRVVLAAHGVGDRSGATGPGRPSLLELGAGGGHTLSHLVKHFDCVAVDLSREMLDQARLLIPDLTCVVGDMRQVRLGRRFDAVLLHDAVDYMTTPADARAALATARAHLHDGGVTIVAPTYVTETFDDGETEADQHQGPGDAELRYVSHVRRADDDPHRFTLTMLMVEREQGRLGVWRDQHVCGLFAESDWLAWLNDAGFDACVLPLPLDSPGHLAEPALPSDSWDEVGDDDGGDGDGDDDEADEDEDDRAAIPWFVGVAR